MTLMRGPSGISETANLFAALAYVVVTILLYRLLAPTNRPLALVAAGFSLAGCLISLVDGLHLADLPVGPLPFFGVYCLLTGWLVWQSQLVPRWIGIALMVGGLGWLTFALPDLRRALFPYNMAPAILAETALAIALLFVRPMGQDMASKEAD